jgi:hypothetical protein
VGVQDFSGDHLQCVLLSLVGVSWSDIKNMLLINCAEFEVMGASRKASVLFALTVILGVTNYANGQLLSSLPKSLIVTATRAGGANLSGTGTIATSLSSIYSCGGQHTFENAGFETEFIKPREKNFSLDMCLILRNFEELGFKVGPS